MKKTFLKIFLLIIIFLWVNFFAYKTLPIEKYFPEKNIIFLEKSETEPNKKNILIWKNLRKISSKWIFLKSDLVLSTAHWVESEDDNYKVFFNEKNADLALLKVENNDKKVEKINFWKIWKNEKEIYFFDGTAFTRAEIEKIEENKIFVKEEFLPWSSGTIFFDKDKKIVWILSEYDLKERLWVVVLVDESIFEKFEKKQNSD